MLVYYTTKVPFGQSRRKTAQKSAPDFGQCVPCILIHKFVQ
nr:MAG TPA: protein of unknown function (DUF4512) [Caudoviricetes sp.]